MNWVQKLGANWVHILKIRSKCTQNKQQKQNLKPMKELKTKESKI